MSSYPVRILGFDPGLADTGWGVIDWYPGEKRITHMDSGVISTSSQTPIDARVIHIARAIGELMHDSAGFDTHCPPLVFAEGYRNYGKVFWNGVQTLYTLGILAACANERGYWYKTLGARESKLALGVDTGKKTDVAKRVQAILGLVKRPHPLHASDALGIALAGLVDCERSLTLVSKGVNVFDGATHAVRGASAKRSRVTRRG